jgi:CubicO group peptidase (beta-lactamase class C family)
MVFKLGLAICLSIGLGQPLATAAAPSTLFYPSAMSFSTEPSTASTTAIAAELEALVQAYADHRQFMGTVLVVRGGETLLSQGYGMADLEQQIPHTLDTRFLIGSVTKQFTAAATPAS